MCSLTGRGAGADHALAGARPHRAWGEGVPEVGRQGGVLLDYYFYHFIIIIIIIILFLLLDYYFGVLLDYYLCSS